MRTLNICLASFYRQSVLAVEDWDLAVEIKKIHFEDDYTLGHETRAPLLGRGKSRVLRVMKEYSIIPRKPNKKYNYHGKSNEIFANLANDPAVQLNAVGIVFSDIFEFKLADGTRIRGCFALKKEPRQILSLIFDYSMTADLVVTTIKRVDLVVSIVSGTLIRENNTGQKVTITALIEKGSYPRCPEPERRPITHMPSGLSEFLNMLFGKEENIIRLERF